ncbi:hypothetical protein [Natronincola ferrireducens]|uniref:Uncharacterized protein n=1 Tax=Natronincola ferrireducens TaxID=393762 RepID=A0A1G9FRP7_9FIRM|nr:hypothetical protein [Natronincola ferrireducens]SDK91069.1 hypothetical protein SAMN05660472_02226 [Natronincola ferrireducens]
MITIVYRLIIVYILGLVLWNLFEETEIKMQANNALVIIPLILRVLMIK